MKRLHVVVGILQDDLGRVCISKRPTHKHLGDLWEFPGGKVETNEHPTDALKREFFEELGVHIDASQAFMQIPFDYDTHQVFLDFFLITQFHGQAHGKEGQEIRWVYLDELHNYPIPDANQPIVTALMKKHS